MRLQFNREIKLWVVGFGVHEPKSIIEVDEERGKKMLETGYFDEIIEKKPRKRKSKKERS